MKQILRLRSRETMLQLTSLYNNSPVHHPLSANFFFTAYNDAKNKEIVLGDKEESRNIIGELTK